MCWELKGKGTGVDLNGMRTERQGRWRGAVGDETYKGGRGAEGNEREREGELKGMEGGRVGSWKRGELDGKGYGREGS